MFELKADGKESDKIYCIIEDYNKIIYSHNRAVISLTNLYYMFYFRIWLFQPFLNYLHHTLISWLYTIMQIKNNSNNKRIK